MVPREFWHVRSALARPPGTFCGVLGDLYVAQLFQDGTLLLDGLRRRRWVAAAVRRRSRLVWVAFGLGGVLGGFGGVLGGFLGGIWGGFGGGGVLGGFWGGSSKS